MTGRKYIDSSGKLIELTRNETWALSNTVLMRLLERIGLNISHLDIPKTQLRTKTNEMDFTMLLIYAIQNNIELRTHEFNKEAVFSHSFLEKCATRSSLMNWWVVKKPVEENYESMLLFMNSNYVQPVLGLDLVLQSPNVCSVTMNNSTRLDILTSIMSLLKTTESNIGKKTAIDILRSYYMYCVDSPEPHENTDKFFMVLKSIVVRNTMSTNKNPKKTTSISEDIVLSKLAESYVSIYDAIVNNEDEEVRSPFMEFSKMNKTVLRNLLIGHNNIVKQ